MPASYPTSAKSFSAKLNGDVIAVGHVTDLEAEVTAVETALVAGLPVTHGGTGVTTRTAYGVIVGGTTATGATQTVTPGTSGYLLTSGGASAVPTWTAAVTASAGIEQAFRGLQVRTSPNADVAATTVSVLGLTQWTANDGTLVDDTLTNNTAVISSSGAGGLDTGSEAASTWYEIYRIRKSSDGTLNTLLHRAKDYLLDESQTSDDNSIGLRETSSFEKLAQTFDTDVTGPCERIDVELMRAGSPTGQMWASIYATAAGVPTGAALKTSDKIDVSLISTSQQVVAFIFRDPQTLTAATTYALVLEGNYTVSAVNLINWRENTAGGYAAGQEYQYNGTTWNAIARDMWFKVYVTENDAALTMPSGYDQYCKIGYVYNDSGSNFVAFTALNRTFQYLRSSTTAFATVTATIPTLTDYSANLPPVPCTFSGNVTHSANNQAMSIGGVPDGYSTLRQAFIEPVSAGGRAQIGPAQTTYQAAYLYLEAATGTFYAPFTVTWEG